MTIPGGSEMHARSRLRLGALLERFLAGLIWLDPTAAAYSVTFEVEDTVEVRVDGLGARERWVAPRSRGPVQPVAERLHVIEAGRS